MAMKKTEEVVIRNFEQLETKIRIVGNDPLIVHNWSEKAKKEMLDAQTGKKFKYKFSAGINGTKTSYKGWQFYTLCFKKLKDKTTNINVEWADAPMFKFYNVDLTQNGERPKMTQQMLVEGLNNTQAGDFFFFIDDTNMLNSYAENF